MGGTLNPIFEVRIDRGDGVTILSPFGEIDIYTGPKLRESVLVALEEQPRILVIDVRGVNFMDSTAIGILMTALKRQRGSDRDLRLVTDQPFVIKLLAVTGLLNEFSIYQDVDSAVRDGEISVRTIQLFDSAGGVNASSNGHPKLYST
jgi:anti-sigma B factor antagonist